MTAAALLTLAGLQAMIAISPGPAGVLAIKTAATRGLLAGLFLSLGLAFAIVIWASAALLGLSLVFEVAPFLQTALRVIGAAFLIYIGWTMWRHASEPLSDSADVPLTTGGRLIRLGLYTNLANPKALAYFAAVFTGIMPLDPSMADGVLILTVVFCIEFAWYAAVTLVFSRPAPRRAYTAAKGWIDRTFGAVLACLGIRIALP